MSTHTFFSPALPSVGGRLDLTEPEAFHAVHVLRLGPGAVVRLVDGAGVVVASRAGRRVHVQLEVTEREQLAPPLRPLHLYVAPPRAKQMAHVVRSCTELGVWAVQPILCRFSVARPEGAETWQPEAVAALKQSGNPFLPRIAAPLPFADALAACSMPGWFGSSRAAASEEGGFARAGADALSLWIGPEGGFSQDETEALQGRGLRPLRVGAFTLRVETAVAAAVGCLYGRGCLA